MRCGHVRSLITKQQSEALTPDQEALLERHLESCSACRLESDGVRQMSDMLAETGKHAVGIEGVSRPDTAAVLARTRSQTRQPWLSFAPLAAGMAAAALVTIGFVWYRSGSHRPGAPQQIVVKPRNPKPFTAPQFVQTPTNGGPNNAGNKSSNAPLPQDRGPSIERRTANGAKPGIWPPTYDGAPEAMPGWKEPKATDDLQYLNPDSSVTVANWRDWPSDSLLKRQSEMEQSVKGGDDFVNVPAPQIAGGDPRAIQAARDAYQQERAIVDTRLVRKVTVAAKGISFAELCRRLSTETGVNIRASRRVAEDKLTVFCRERPLRDLMREIAGLFNFIWDRTGKEGAYEYELTQSLKSQLLEEALRQKDRDELLLELDRQMALYRPYLGLSRAEIAERMKALVPKIKDKTVFQEYNRLTMLDRGGFAGLNLFFRLSQPELDALKSGEELRWDLRSARLGLPPAFVDNAQAAMEESTGPLRPGEKAPSNKLETTLKLEVSRDGTYTLRSGLYGERGGTSAPLAHAKSPSADDKKLDNAKENVKLAVDSELQRAVSLTVKETARLEIPPFPDTEFAYIEKSGPKVTTADVLEAIHITTGKDVIGDYFSRLHAPSAVSVERVKLFSALSHAGDAMNMRWSKADGWLTFRSPDYYYLRPQEVPTPLLERWAETRKKNGVLGPDELAEIAELTDVQLDSTSTAQAAVALYGLTEWPVARVKEARPLWRFYGKLSRGLRADAMGPRGVAFINLPPTLKREYVELARCADVGIWPSEAEMKDARLRLIYTPENNVFSDKKPVNALLPPGNTVVFLFGFGQPTRYSAAGPFNGTYGLSQPMLDQRLNRTRAE